VTKSAGLFLIPTLLAGLSTTAAAQEKWLQVHTPHFLLLTNANEKQARDAGLRFEESRAVFGRSLGKNKLQTTAPIQIVVFRNDATMQPYLPCPQESAAGYFLEGKDRSFMVVSLEAPSPFVAALHGYARSMLHSNYPKTDAWFEEGLAQYFSTTDVNKKATDIGIAPSGAVELLRQGSWMPLAELLRVPRSAIAHESSPMDRFRAQAWITVHYLLAHDQMDGVSQYFDLVKNQQKPAAEAVQQAFGMSPEKLQESIRAYAVDAADKAKHLPPPEPVRGDEFNVVQLNPLDAQALLADLQIHMEAHREEAATTFQSIIREDPENAAAYRGLGYALYLQKDYEKAAGYLERAISLTPGDPQLLWYLSLTFQARYNKDHPSYPALIEGEMQRAVKVDPDFAEGYRLLAWSRIQQTKAASALEAAKSAVALRPSDESVLQELGDLYEAARQWDNAEYVFHHLRNSDDPAIAKYATDELVVMAKRKRGEYVAPKESEQEATSQVPATVARTQSSEEELPAELPPDTRPSKFVKGILSAVNCDSKGAVLTLLVPAKTKARVMRIKVADRAQAVLVGADTFSCEWKGVKAAVNYKAGAAPGTKSDADGDLVSLEVEQ
jgi:tetratricopeptide (TPR) repeat protein